jgi:hypothetical protein
MNKIDSTIQQLLTKLHPTTPWQPRQKLWLGFAGLLLYFLLLLLIFGVHSEIHLLLNNAMFLLETVGYVLMILLSMVACIFGAVPDGKRPWWLNALLTLPLWLVVGIGMLQFSWTELVAILSHLQYFLLFKVLLLTLLPGILLAWVLRFSAPAECCWTGFFAALAASGMAYLTLRWLAITPVEFFTPWCYLPMLIFLLLGIGLERLLLRW